MSDFFSNVAKQVKDGDLNVTGNARYLSKRAPCDFEATLHDVKYGPSSDPKKKGVTQLILTFNPTNVRSGSTGRDGDDSPVEVGELVTIYLGLDAKNELAIPKQAAEAIELIAGLTGRKSADLMANMADIGTVLTDAAADLIGKPYLVTSKPPNKGWYNSRVTRADAA